MIRFLVLLLTFCVASLAVRSAFIYLGFTLTTMTLTALLTLSYVLRYRQRGLGLGLAYWGLIYAALAIGFLVVGLFHSHAGCPDLIRGNYCPTQPWWLKGFRTVWFGLLSGANVFAVMTVGKNLKELFTKPKP